MGAKDSAAGRGTGISLSVVMPVYNEAGLLREIVARVLASPLVTQLVIVDDGSTDETGRIAAELAGRHPRVEVLSHPANRGKGASVRDGIPRCAGDAVVIQDADLEYDPRDYDRLVEPIASGRADVVYGSRYLGRASFADQRISYRLANRLLTAASNLATGLGLTDMETCYKCFRREVVQGLDLEQDRFGIEVEITAELAREGHRVEEVGIAYESRDRAQGKKIGVKDGIEALLLIGRFWLKGRLRGR